MSFPFIFHGQSSDWVTRSDNTLIVRLATEKSVCFDKVMLRHEPDNEEYLVEMTKHSETEYLTIWQASFTLNSDRAISHYVFKLLTKTGQYWLDGKGVSKRISPKELHFKYNTQHQPPAWVREQVFYQIFPDRFSNGKPELSVKNGEYFVRGGTQPVVAKPWGEPVDGHDSNVKASGTGGCEFYGGDLYGVENKLDYLQELGVTAIYLNPIFTAPSNHKYDTSDYKNVDPHLGSNAHFATLCDKLHQRDMRIMLDAVFNHTSTEHPWFNLQGLHNSIGAYQGKDSAYRDYYFFEGDSNQYIGWKGIQSLPVLNFHNQAVCDYIYNGDDAIIKHWLKPPYNIDAWRFDVIHMLGEGEGAKNNAHYVKAFRDAAKAVNPDCYVLGEHFFEASQWLQGDQEDGAMNYYGFAHPVRALLAKLDITFDPIDIGIREFLDWQAEARAKIPWSNQLSQLNQLDSHDTARFLELVKHDPRLFKLASMLLFSYVGTPCLYYGTELGMEGSHDPDNRRCMAWEKVAESEYLPWFKQLINVRKAHPALSHGDYVPLFDNDDCFAYARQYKQDIVIMAVNLSDAPQMITLPIWRLGTTAINVVDCSTATTYNGTDGKLTLTLEPVSAMLLSE